MGRPATNTDSTTSRISSLKTLGTSLVVNGLAATTQASYRSIWSKFTRFCSSVGHPKWAAMPVSTDSVFLFLTDQISSGISGRSLTSQCSAIAYFHKLRSMPDPTNSFVIRKLITGAQRYKPSQDKRKPITLPILHKLSSALPLVTPSWYMTELFQSLFLVAFYGFFRIGELIPLGKNTANKVIQLSDVSFHGETISGPSAVTLLIRNSKNLSPGSSTQVCLESRQYLCPVKALRTFISSRGRQPGPLFALPDGCPVIRTQFSQLLARCVTACGLKGRYLAHSFRIGATTQAALDGKSEMEIRHLGRWQSDTYKHYIRMHASRQ